MQKVENIDETPAFAKHVLPAVPSSEVYLEDCVKALKRFDDNYFDVAIVDPPYGIGEDGGKARTRGSKRTNGEKKGWDNQRPNAEYFSELLRVSKNQIIWGGNYFISRLPYDSSCWLVWDKNNGNNDNADAELAWTSFNTAVRKYTKHISSTFKDRIHPTQKPKELYKWCLNNYAKEGDLILDTHLGSGSSRIACNELNFAFTGFEIDKDYYEAQEKRFKDFVSQLRMF